MLSTIQVAINPSLIYIRKPRNIHGMPIPSQPTLVHWVGRQSLSAMDSCDKQNQPVQPPDILLDYQLLGMRMKTVSYISQGA